MSALWQQSLVPQIDANGDPLVGAQAFFYNTGTLTPQTTYANAGLSEPSTHDDDGAVVTDANGRFPAVFLNATPGTYRVRMLDPDGVVLFDVDGVSVPQNADYVPPDAGSTDPTLLFTTGDIIARHGTGAHSGWVRAAGRTIGSATSGASERANADTSALFQHLWNSDSTLAVSTGRGANAAADFAANKTIALPDYRSRSLVGLADMGNSASTILSGVTVDNSETVSTLGATLGEGTHTLVTSEMASHTHSDGTLAAANHGHPFVSGFGGSNNESSGGIAMITANVVSEPAYTGTPSASDRAQIIGGSGAVDVSGSTGSVGSDAAHNNTQPSALVTFYIKL
jgi:microcystin-dependent protein